jgi:DnaJ-class molecular chaperone
LIWAHPIPRRPYYAVVDFGGGTLDVTVMEFGKGLQKYGGGGRGSLNLRIQVHLPEHPGAGERALYEQLRSLHAGNGGQKKRC